MDRSSLVGLTLIVIGVAGGQLLEGGQLSSLLQPAAFLIVAVGTLGAVFLQSPSRDLYLAMNILKWIIFPPESNRDGLVVKLTRWADIARKKGLLILEEDIGFITDIYLKKGLTLLVDGNSSEKINGVLDNDIDIFQSRYAAAITVWSAAGGYSPTIGIIGAVLGLIHVMENLGDPSKLGAGIAVAFVATIYGVGLANLLFLPIAQKLNSILDHETQTKEMIKEALVSIANGDNPRIVAERAEGYLT